MTDKMKEIIERARWEFSALVMKGKIPKPSGREVSTFIAKALSDADFIHRDELVTDEAIERACVGFEAEYMRAAKPDDEDFGLAWPDRTDAYRAGTRALIRIAIQAAIGEGT